MNKFRTAISGILATIVLSLSKVSIGAAQSVRSGVEAARGADQPTVLFGDGAIFSTAVNVLLFLIGAIAVIMIIFGGFKYVISGGDSAAVTSAKNTILYAIIGVVVAILAYAIITFVLDSLATGTAGGL